jgi:hypothetical protein
VALAGVAFVGVSARTAPPNTGMADPSALVTAFDHFVVMGATPDVVHGADDRAGIERCAPALLAVEVEHRLESIVHEMWHRSPTFRRQVMRLTDEPALVVTIAIWRVESWSGPRARTRFSLERGLLRRAQVEVKLAGEVSLVELIAHELEHVLEQLDGVNLVQAARGPGATAIRDEREHSFETARARQVGLAVAAEYQAGSVREGRRHGAPR